jgi:CPA2 family monovalent cation:H+ antiporter-2
MENHAFLFEIVLLLTAAIITVVLFERLRVSPMLGYLAGGMIIGPSGLALVFDVETIGVIGELGVVMLLFSIGLELSFKRLKLMRWEVFGLGGAQFVITGLIIAGVAWALGASPKAAFVIGAGLALSSTAIVLQLLSERGEVATKLGRVGFSVLLLQDLAVVPLLAVVPILGGAARATDWGQVGLAIGKAALALVLIMVAGRLVLQPIYRTVARDHGHEIFIALTLLAVLGTGWATEQAGLSLTLGAFLAGLLLAETEFRHQVQADIKPFQGLLMGLFFMAIGMQVDLAAAARNWWIVAALTLALLALKTAILYLLCRVLVKLPVFLSLRVGLTLAQGGEFAFILIGSAALIGFIPEPMKQICLIVVSASMIATPFLTIFGKALADRFERFTPVGLAALEQDNIDLARHVVIAGFGRVGRIVARLLEARRLPYVAIDSNAANVLDGRSRGLPVYFGNAAQRELLWSVGVDRASALIVTMGDAPVALELVDMLKHRLPELPIIARARDSDHARDLLELGADIAVPETLEASLVLGAAALKQYDIGEAEIEATLNELRADRGFLLASDRALPGADQPGEPDTPPPPPPPAGPPASDADLPLPPATAVKPEPAQTKP